jgi:hypothetical protein
MASETARGSSVADSRVGSAPIDGVLCQIKNGAPTSTAEGTFVRIPPSWGEPLSEGDYATLDSSWITPEIADAAMLRRVDDHEGREVIGQRGKLNCAGILFPYYWPGERYIVNYRLRRDKPDWKVGKDGKPKPDKKYLGPPKSTNRLYIPPGVTPEQLQDVTIPIVITEGEKKALALWRLGRHEAERLRFVPVAIAGVWSWRGKVGRADGPCGERIDLKGPIADLGRIAWKARKALVVFDTNVHSDDNVDQARKGIARELGTRQAEVKFVNLPEDCGVNGVDDLLVAWGPARVLDLFERSVSGSMLHIVLSPQFRPGPDGMFRVTTKGERLTQVQLTNYQAAITTNIRLDDGVEVRREFEIESELMGRRSRFRIPASEFASMDWPIEWLGAAAITFPNQREYARTAIQSLSLTATEKCVYTHTGWRNVDGHWVYLHAGGAIGVAGPVSNVSVRFSGAIDRYELCHPAQSDALVPAVRASLRLVELGPPSISFPLLAATFRAVFGDADFALHLVGETGAFKSELAALQQQHFGAAMNRLHLPGGWSSTGNALEALAFHAKDALFVIDDFAPHGSATDVARYHAAADRVFRAAGNHAGRGRLDSTAKLREPKPPRALILSTGEEIPRGQSVRARLLILEISKGSVDGRELANCQRDALAGRYAEAMAGFLQWFAGRYEEARTAFEAKVSQYRAKALSNTAHARTPEIVASLQAAFELWLEFGVASVAIDVAEAGRLAARCWEALCDAAAAQAKHQGETEPTARFLSLLRSVLSSGRAHLEARTGGEPDRAAGSCGWRRDAPSPPIPLGDCIGWLDDDNLYLELHAAFRATQMAARDSGEAFAISEHTLKRRLREKGLLASVDRKRETLTIRKSIAGSSRDVLHFWRATVLPEEPEINNQEEG